MQNVIWHIQDLFAKFQGKEKLLSPIFETRGGHRWRLYFCVKSLERSSAGQVGRSRY